MDDVTDTVFRRVIQECASPDLFFTEFINVDGLQSSGRKNIFKRLRATSNEKPLVAQFWGKNPDNFYKTARQIVDGSLRAELGNEIEFIGFDINMGCPDKAIMKNGCCGALIKNRSLAGEIINASKEGLNDEVPLSVKTRLGLGQIDLSWIDFLLSHDLAMLSVHARTIKEKSLVPAHHEFFKEIVTMRDKQAPHTLVVGNGDIVSREQGEQISRASRLDGVMIGRGVFDDPYVFSDDSPWENFNPIEKTKLYKKHVEIFENTWRSGERKVHTLNKFCKIYISGFDGAKECREQLMSASTTRELKSVLANLEKNLRVSSPSAT